MGIDAELSPRPTRRQVIRTGLAFAALPLAAACAPLAALPENQPRLASPAVNDQRVALVGDEVLMSMRYMFGDVRYQGAWENYADSGNNPAKRLLNPEKLAFYELLERRLRFFEDSESPEKLIVINDSYAPPLVRPGLSSALFATPSGITTDPIRLNQISGEIKPDNKTPKTVNQELNLPILDDFLDQFNYPVSSNPTLLFMPYFSPRIRGVWRNWEQRFVPRNAVTHGVTTTVLVQYHKEFAGFGESLGVRFNLVLYERLGFDQKKFFEMQSSLPETSKAKQSAAPLEAQYLDRFHQIVKIRTVVEDITLQTLRSPRKFANT